MTDYRLIPGPNGPVRIGADHDVIQRLAFDNIVELEDEMPEKSYYVVCMETTFVPVSLTDERLPTEMEFRPQNLIIASTMKDAIKMFESETISRYWIPGNRDTRFELQRGLPQTGSDFRIVRITKVRKDCVIVDDRHRTAKR